MVREKVEEVLFLIWNIQKMIRNPKYENYKLEKKELTTSFEFLTCIFFH